MVNAVLIFLIYGPIIVTLACWLVLAIENSRAGKSAVVRVLSRERPDRE